MKSDDRTRRIEVAEGHDENNHVEREVETEPADEGATISLTRIAQAFGLELFQEETVDGISGRGGVPDHGDGRTAKRLDGHGKRR